MKVSLKWLGDYVDIAEPPEQVAERLTMAGLEVGEMQVIGAGWNNVVVGRIVGVDAHPNADRLRLVTVDLGKQQSTVVCGAPNLAVGDKVAFAYVGAELVDGHSGGVIELRPGKIRGVVSEGMVCSEKELGISDRHEGIMVLSPEAPVGASLSECIGDTILNLDITPNRPDCLSVIGIAREVAALTENKLSIPEVNYEESESAIDSFASVEIADPDLCPRYCASLLTGVEVGSSPQWLQQRLLACGMRPISNIVDVTNYVMLEYGQPLHAFDYDRIRGKGIVVRRAEVGETMTALDGVERTLSQDLLVIADRERSIAIAGIMGGLDTEVTADTTSVLIESANFDRAVIHRGRTNLRLSSEASLRFEKGLSRDLPMVALRRATQLMLEVAGGKAAKGVIDVYPGARQVEPILLSAAEVERLLGMDIGISEIVRALELLGFSCQETELASSVQVNVPWWRTDINCTADLVEEVARVIGYDNIPITMLSASLPEHESVPMLELRPKVRSILVSCGFQEVLTYSLTSLEVMKRLSPELRLEGEAPAKVANPMSRDHEYLRTSLRTGLLSVVARNEKYQENGIKAFEIGKVFLPRKEDLPQERDMLCAVLGGSQRGLFWWGEKEPVEFFTAKGVVETLLSRLELSASFETSEDQSLCPGRGADIVVGIERIGVVGELHPKILEAFELSGTAYVIEIDLDRLLSLAPVSKKYEPISRYPSTTRDIALLVDEHIAYQQVCAIVQDSPLVNDVYLFDVYYGEQVPAGKKSFAFRIIYQASTHTLTDEEVDKVQRLVLERLEQELGAALRT